MNLQRVARARIDVALRIRRQRRLPILEPSEIVAKVLSLSQIPAVAFSGGKASLVVLDIVRKIRPDILVIFNNTGVEHPKTVKYVHELRDLWHLNLVETQPIRTFWQCVEQYGFPQIRAGKDSKAHGAKRNTRTPACCRLLKELPAVHAYREHHVDTIFTGIQAGESRVRFLSACQKGPYFYGKKWRLFKCNPLIYKTDDWVWDYIHKNALPYNPLYDQGHDRVGCMPCTGFISWQNTLAKTDPKMLKFILDKMGQPGLDRWLKTRYDLPPCEGGALS